jgi:hypothetical protein
MDEMYLQALRRMAWQRAKGELLSILETYYGETSEFDLVSDKIKSFIKDIEYNTNSLG